MYKRKFIIVILIGIIIALNLTVSPILSHVTCQSAHAETIEQNPNANESSTLQPAENDSIFNRIFGSRQDSIREQESWQVRVIRAFISFSLALPVWRFARGKICPYFSAIRMSPRLRSCSQW
jgi:hypothetical protein